MGHSWTKRTAAKAMGYGTGRLREEIHQTGDKITFKIASPGSSEIENTIFVNGVEQSTKDPEGVMIKNIPNWDGCTLVSTTSNLTTGKFIARICRSLQGEVMSVEMTDERGNVVHRIFERQ